MTTLKDYLRDLVNEAITFGEDDERTQKTSEWVDEKLDEYIDIIKERIIG